jgi:hypothetical protein
MAPEEQLTCIYDHTGRFFADQRAVLKSDLLPALREEGIDLVAHTATSQRGSSGSSGSKSPTTSCRSSRR